MTYASRLFALSFLLSVVGAGAADPGRWLHMHPGGGGQIQGISSDPNIPGRLYTCSDVEGMYRSDDWGLSWRSIGRGIIHHMVFYVAVDPRNSDTLYAGTLYGLSKSPDGGKTWSTLAGGYASASFDFDPFVADRFIAGHSWYIKDSQLTSQTSQPDQEPTGTRQILLSEDGGRSFLPVIYEKASGYAQCYSVTFDPTRRGHVFLGAFAGLYRSTDGGRSFTRLPAPPGINNPGCSGATLTPDGRFVLATFGTTEGNRFASGTRLYAAPVERIGSADAWRDVSEGLFIPPNGSNQYWNPKVDPRSLREDYALGGTYKVLLGFLNGPVGQLASKQGLHEGTFTVTADGHLTGRFQRIFGKPSASPDFQFDLGWNDIGPQNRQNAYWPLKWDEHELPSHLAALGSRKSRKVYVTNNQQLYVGNADDPLRSWVVLSNRYVRTLNAHRFYQTPGFASTVNYDMDGWGNYMIQGMADNGFMESFDAGASWSQSSGVANNAVVSNGDAVLVLPPRGPSEPALALVGTAPGFGGGAHGATGVLRAKQLTDLSGESVSPGDWKPIAGGQQGDGGLTGGPNGGPRIWYLTAHPSDQRRVFAGTHTGLYYSADIRALVQGVGGAFTKISAAEGSFSFGRIYVDPLSPPDSPVLYIKSVAEPTAAVRLPEVAAGADAPPAADPAQPRRQRGAPPGGGTRRSAGGRNPATVEAEDDSGGPAGRDQLARLEVVGGEFVRTPIRTPTAIGNGDDFIYWRVDSDRREFMAYSDRSASIYVRERAQDSTVWGEWKRVLTQDQIVGLYWAPWWNWSGYTPGGEVRTRMTLTLNGLVGHGGTIVVGSYAAFGKHGYAMLRAERRAEGDWVWTDWTGDENDPLNFMTVPRVWRAKLVEPRPGERYYAAATRGGGLLVRRIDTDNHGRP
jgi:hypothetical protein